MTKYPIREASAGFHDDILNHAEDFSAAFQRLRYEGARNIGANAEAALRVLRSLAGSLLPWMLLEEDEIFPYISRHIPRHEGAIRLLGSEHEGFREKIRSLEEKFDLLVLSPAKERNDLGAVYFESMYLASHVMAYVQNEKEKLFRTIDVELQDGEKSDLLQRIHKSVRAGRCDPAAWKPRD